MLRFNPTVYATFCAPTKFQYILCYGSTISRNFTQRFLADFNTSYVTVQPPPYVRVTNNSFISIHPMLRFNSHTATQPHSHTGFQYILCYGSTGSKRRMSQLSFDFNTSYVTVQLAHMLPIVLRIIISIHPMLRFNLNLVIHTRINVKISIHPMLRFNQGFLVKNSNLFSISIHPMLRFNFLNRNSNVCIKKISIHPMLRFNVYTISVDYMA